VGLVEFENALKAGAFRSARALKGQVEGPITLAAYVFDGDRPFVIEDDYLQAVTAHIGRLAQAQIRMLRQFELRNGVLWGVTALVPLRCSRN
jgi:hypothetical protein